MSDVSSVYMNHGGAKAQGLARAPPDELSEKYDYYGGRKDKALQLNKASPNIIFQKEYRKIYQQISSTGTNASAEADTTYNYLQRIIDVNNVDKMHPATIAITVYIKNTLNIKSFDDLMEDDDILEEFNKLYIDVWRSVSKTYKTCSKKRCEQKFDIDTSVDAEISITGQQIKKDVVRYIHQLFNHEKLAKN